MNAAALAVLTRRHQASTLQLLAPRDGVSVRFQTTDICPPRAGILWRVGPGVRPRVVLLRSRTSQGYKALCRYCHSQDDIWTANQAQTEAVAASRLFGPLP